MLQLIITIGSVKASSNHNTTSFAGSNIGAREKNVLLVLQQKGMSLT
jgi:hypothetical protein